MATTRKKRPTASKPSSKQKKVYTTVGDMPDSFRRDVLMRAFSDYSVALGRLKDGKYSPLGTGVLVKKGNRHGILTAHHCLHACAPEVSLGSEQGDTLALVLSRGRPVHVKPIEAIEHVLAKPTTDEFGPDLTFIEILSIERLGTFKAIGSFWSLDKPKERILKNFGSPLTPNVTIGFPEFHYNKIVDGPVTRHQIRHMTYQNAIRKGAVFKKDGWDYLDSSIWYPGDPDLPLSFSGLSGGPVWGMEIIHRKKTHTYEIGKSALIGITFFEIYRRGDKGRLRAHFINSIYDRAWRSLA